MAHTITLTYTRPNTDIPWHYVPETIEGKVDEYEDSGKIVLRSTTGEDTTTMVKEFKFNSADSENELRTEVAAHITSAASYNADKNITLVIT
jgi:hypothetical protein